MNKNHTLWLLKLSDSNTSRISQNPHIYQTVFNFASEFAKVVESQKDTELIYIGQGKVAPMTSPESVLPLKIWDIVMVTKHENNTDYKTLTNDNKYTKLIAKHPLENEYFVPFAMDPPPGVYSLLANASQLISNVNGYFFRSFDPTFGIAPPYPFVDGSYEFLLQGIKEAQGKGTAESDGDRRKILNDLISIHDQPFLMLNLMQIVNKEQDKKYASNVVGLLHGVGGRLKIRGKSDDYWKQILFVYYPNTRRFWEMITSKNYLSMLQYKEGSLKDVLILLTVPIYLNPNYNASPSVKSKL